MDEDSTNVARQSEADAVKRQQRLAKNIVRLSVFLVGLIALGQLNILTGEVEEVFVVFAIFSLLFGGPLLLGMIVVYLARRAKLER